MAEETDVNTEVVAQEVSQVPQEQATEAQQQQAPSPAKKDEEVNWKKARELLEAQKREIDRYQQELSKIANSQPKEEDELAKLSEDDILTKKQAEKLAQQQFKKLYQDFENQKGEDKARGEFNDYDAIVSQENLERLQNEHPEVVESLKSTPSLYHKAKTAYKFIKAVYGNQEAAANKESLEKNLAKPRSVNSLGSAGVLSQAAAFEKGLTPDLKKQLLSEMILASKKT